jgi:hypothetical protein
MFHSVQEVVRGFSRNATEGMATPAGLPVWSVLLGLGQIGPVALAIAEPGWRSAALLGLAIVPRLALAIRFRQPVWSAVLHPAGIAGLLGIQWWALIRAWRGGAPEWRGRLYPVAKLAAQRGPGGVGGVAGGRYDVVAPAGDVHGLQHRGEAGAAGPSP